MIRQMGQTLRTHIFKSFALLFSSTSTFLPFQERLRDYSRAFDLSRSDEVKVHQLAVTMALDGQPLEQIEKLLAVAVGTSSLSVHGVVQDAVERIVSALRCLFACDRSLQFVCYLCPSFLRFPLFCALSLSLPTNSSAFITTSCVPQALFFPFVPSLPLFYMLYT